MKKCPYCAEDIQDEAIKCKHCGEFLDQTADIVRRQPDRFPWYFRISFIIFALLCVGPLALPLIWLRPRTAPVWKIVLTILILAVSWFLYQATLESLRVLKEYYKLLDSL